MSDANRQTITLAAESVPVVAKADVVVAGGGTSGFIAATAAARSGARTILVERFGYLGGCTTAPYNTSLSSFFDSEGVHVIRGIPWEFMKRMEADGCCILGPGPRNQIWPPWTKKVALDMIEEAGVELYLHTWVFGVVNDGQTIAGIVLLNKGGRGVILANAFVDATGDADLAAFAGAPFEMAETDELQQVSCDYVVCGVDAERVRRWANENRRKFHLRVGGADEELRTGVQNMLTIVIPNRQKDPQGDEHHVGVMPTVKLCIYREAARIQGNADINPLDPKALTQAEAAGMRGALEHLRFLKDTVPGFENAFPVAQAHLGVRETRRIRGDHMLTIDEVKGGKRFDDVVALNCRALDYHLKGTVFKLSHIAGHHDIPLRALLPQGIANLAVAGRAISCDHLSQASLRGAATCMATGHAAGVAAALAARQGCGIRQVAIEEIQAMLVAQEAFLGELDRKSRC